MSMTDPIADLLTRIRNAQTARHDSVLIPASRIKVEIVRILKDEGYVADYRVVEEVPQNRIEVDLKYDRGGTKAISSLERISRPGRRVYCGKDEIPKVLNGMGVTILSTSRGVMTGSGCRTAGIGGEVLCNIW